MPYSWDLWIVYADPHTGKMGYIPFKNITGFYANGRGLGIGYCGTDGIHPFWSNSSARTAEKTEHPEAILKVLIAKLIEQMWECRKRSWVTIQAPMLVNISEIAEEIYDDMREAALQAGGN